MTRGGQVCRVYKVSRARPVNRENLDSPEGRDHVDRGERRVEEEDQAHQERTASQGPWEERVPEVHPETTAARVPLDPRALLVLLVRRAWEQLPHGDPTLVAISLGLRDPTR